MKKFTIAFIGASLAAGVASVQAEDVGGGFDVSMNAALTTDYVWRGISQSDNHMAIQGGLDVGHSTGFYAGTWGSSVDFDAADGDANSEFDFYYGYGGEAGPVGYDVGYVAYTYPDGREANFEEIYASVSVVGVTFGVASSGAVVGEDSTTYLSLDYEVEVPGEVGLAAHIGQYDFKDDTFTDDDGDTEDTYIDYSVSASKTFLGADWSVAYSDTDLNDDECESFTGKDDPCDGIFALSVSKAL